MQRHSKLSEVLMLKPREQPIEGNTSLNVFNSMTITVCSGQQVPNLAAKFLPVALLDVGLSHKRQVEASLFDEADNVELHTCGVFVIA